MQVGQCSCPNQFFVLYGLANAVDPDYCSAPYRLANVVLKSFLRAIQVGQCSWPKSLLRAYWSAGSDTYPCHTGRPMQLAQFISPCHTSWPDMILSMSYRSANALGANHSPMPYRLAGYNPICVIQVGQCSWPKSLLRAIQVAGSDPYPCHTGRPMHLAQIIAPCHTGWPDLIPIRVIQVGQCTWPKSLLCAIQVGRI